MTLSLRVRHVAGPPVVAIRVWLPGGIRAESEPGLGWATGRMLTEGTRLRSWEQIALDAESLGAAISGVSGVEVHGLALDGLSHDWEQLIDWAVELLLESRFPAERLAWVVRQGEGELAALYDSPDSATYLAFLEQQYFPHPRSRPAPGSVEALARLTSDQLKSFHQAAMGRGPLVTIAGRIDVEQVEQKLSRIDWGITEPSETRFTPPEIRGLADPRRKVSVDGEGQAHLFLGQFSVPRLHEEYESLELAGVVLGSGAGLTGRIPERVREQEGLAYSASAATVVDAGTDPGRISFYVGTSLDTVDAAERLVREEIDRILESGVETIELANAKTYLLGREPFRHETARQWANRLAEGLYWGYPAEDAEWRSKRLMVPDRLQVNAALRRFLRPKELKVTIGS